MRWLYPALTLVLFLAALPARGCDVALALTIDVSGSINADEYRLQMEGLAAALEDGAVVDALVGAKARVAVIQWSGSSRQEVTVPWTDLLRPGDVAVLAAQVRAAERPWQHFSTAIGDMLTIAGTMMETVDCKRKVIDISGDGFSNEGIEPSVMRDALVARGVDINALAIVNATAPLLADYFRDHVIGGPNAFVYTATGFSDYPRAIRRKLLDEVTEPVS